MFNFSHPQKRLPLIRLYTCLALLASVFVTVAGVLEAVSYFVFAVCLLASDVVHPFTTRCTGGPDVRVCRVGYHRTILPKIDLR